jgi:hypothetical protein
MLRFCHISLSLLLVLEINHLSWRHLSWIDHLSSADSELAAPRGWQKSGLSQDLILTQILSDEVLALDNANTNKSL